MLNDIKYLDILRVAVGLTHASGLRRPLVSLEAAPPGHLASAEAGLASVTRGRGLASPHP